VSRRTWLLALVALATAAVAGFSAGPVKQPRQPVYPQLFPTGDGKAIAERSCLICHSATLVTQQAKDSSGWEKSMAQMEKWGVKLTPAEHDSLRRYLLTHFGPRRAR
jgi:mono/diheme cytochrome c family protein